MTTPAVVPPPVFDRSDLLRQTLTRQFATRPTLYHVVSEQLNGALKKTLPDPGSPLDLDRAYIVWTIDAAEQPLTPPRYRLLLDAMLEHIALGTPLNYGYYEPEQCFLALLAEGATPAGSWASLASMRAVEMTMRDVQRQWPRAFQEALIAYWNQPVTGYRSRVHWLQVFLADNLRVVVNTTAGLDPEQIEAVRKVLNYPVLVDRLRGYAPSEQPRVYFAQLEVRSGKWLHRHVVADLLVSYSRNGSEQLLRCTPSGQITAFATVEALTRQLGHELNQRYVIDAVTCKRFEPMVDALHVQAMIVLNTQLEALAAIRQAMPGDGRSLARLERHVRAVTDPVSLFETFQAAPSGHLLPVFNALPDWLKHASQTDRAAYRRHVIALADVTRNARGRTFNEGIPDLHTYAAQALHRQMREDQPQAPGYDPDEIELQFKVASGPLGTIGTVQTRTYSLTELALENLIGFPGARMTLRHTRNQLIQDWWLTPEYIKSLIQRVNIGETYPALIKHWLLDDPKEAQRREVLYAEQLRVTLPMRALEMKLQGRGSITQWGYRCLAALMQRDPAARLLDGQRVGIRALGLVQTPRSVPDFVRNMYVIGLADDLEGPCVLYRPLLKEMLIEFPSALALVQGLIQAGELRDSVLEWLPGDLKNVYAQGVMNPSNHLPASSALLFAQPLHRHFEHDLFRESAMTLVQLADRQSVSNAESRWATLKQGGWLLLNTVLPLIRGPVAIFGWLLLTVSALKNDIAALRGDDERLKAPAIIDVLFNIAVVLLHGGQMGTQTPASEHVADESLAPLIPVDAGPPLRAADDEPAPAALPVSEGAVYFPGVAVGNQHTELDFSWFSTPRIDFSEFQLTWLDRNRGPALGPALPVAYGPYRGLYVVNGKWHALVRGFSYQVSLEDDGVVVVSPQDERDTGPWLRHDADGNWDFDTGLRLRGGGPKKRQEAQARAEQRKQRIKELDAAFAALGERESELFQQLTDERLRLYEALQGEASQRFSYLEKTLRLKRLRTLVEKANAEYQVELDHFIERHALQPRPNDHVVLSRFYNLLFRHSVDLLYVQTQLIQGIKNLYPEFAVVEHKEMSTVDAERYVTFKRALLAHQQTFFNDFQAQTRYLEAMRGVPRIGHRLARELETSAATSSRDDGAVRRTSDIDFLNLQLGLLLDLTPKTVFSETWHNLADIISPLTYTASAHAELVDTELFSHDERMEVLEDIGQRYAGAQDALSILNMELGDQLNPADYQRLMGVLEQLVTRIEQQLAEEARLENQWLPEQPRPSRKSQGSKRIIRTRKQGILIGVARARASEREPLIVDVGEPAAGSTQTQPGPAESGLPTLTFRQSEADRWEPVEHPVAAGTERPLATIRNRCNELLGKVDEKIQRVRGYARHSRFALELEEILEREALKLDALSREIEAGFELEPVQDKPRPGTPQSLLKRLREGARKLREQALWILKSLPPTEPVVEYLLEKGEVHIVKTGPRIQMQGERQDFVQEYEVRNRLGQVQWYAHLHYHSLTDPAGTPNAAHFKLKSQRRVSQASLDAKARPGEKAERVHYGKISARMLARRFLSLSD